MGIFKVTLPTQEVGYVEAYNYQSAKIQLKWLLLNKECFCPTHCEEYVKTYSVTLTPSYEDCILHPKGSLVTPSDVLGGTKYLG